MKFIKLNPSCLGIHRFLLIKLKPGPVLTYHYLLYLHAGLKGEDELKSGLVISSCNPSAHGVGVLGLSTLAAITDCPHR